MRSNKRQAERQAQQSTVPEPPKPVAASLYDRSWGITRLPPTYAATTSEQMSVSEMDAPNHHRGFELGSER